MTFARANASVLSEGPLGTSGGGSWLVSARHSRIDWPVRPMAELSGTGGESGVNDISMTAGMMWRF